MCVSRALIQTGEFGINARSITKFLCLCAGSAANSVDTCGFSAFDGRTRFAGGAAAVRVGIFEALTTISAIVVPGFASNGAST